MISRNFQGVEELKKKKTMEILRAGVNNVKLLERENTWGWGIKLDKENSAKGMIFCGMSHRNKAGLV